MKTITYQDIMSWSPCYDPVARGLCTPDWSGTALDILRAEHIPAEDRLWVVLREELIDPRALRLFAVWCARRALARIANPDPRSIAACDIAERHANGQATDEELDAARVAASDAWADAAAADAAAAARSAASAADAAARSAQITKLIEMLEDNTQ